MKSKLTTMTETRQSRNYYPMYALCPVYITIWHSFMCANSSAQFLVAQENEQEKFLVYSCGCEWLEA